MSEEQRNEETEVEAHGSRVSGTRASGTRASANDEPEDEVEGHVSKASTPKYS